ENCFFKRFLRNKFHCFVYSTKGNDVCCHRVLDYFNSRLDDRNADYFVLSLYFFRYCNCGVNYDYSVVLKVSNILVQGSLSKGKK
ncbi:MAG: hypothetical protein II354_02405, partial [Firmicutes bacterium]|nr:hypothetical protein [Bacillota bacterium]